VVAADAVFPDLQITLLGPADGEGGAEALF